MSQQKQEELIKERLARYKEKSDSKQLDSLQSYFTVLITHSSLFKAVVSRILANLSTYWNETSSHRRNELRERLYQLFYALPISDMPLDDAIEIFSNLFPKNLLQSFSKMTETQYLADIQQAIKMIRPLELAQIRGVFWILVLFLAIPIPNIAQDFFSLWENSVKSEVILKLQGLLEEKKTSNPTIQNKIITRLFLNAGTAFSGPILNMMNKNRLFQLLFQLSNSDLILQLSTLLNDEEKKRMMSLAIEEEKKSPASEQETKARLENYYNMFSKSEQEEKTYVEALTHAFPQEILSIFETKLKRKREELQKSNPDFIATQTPKEVENYVMEQVLLQFGKDNLLPNLLHNLSPLETKRVHRMIVSKIMNEICQSKTLTECYQTVLNQLKEQKHMSPETLNYIKFLLAECPNDNLDTILTSLVHIPKEFLLTDQQNTGTCSDKRAPLDMWIANGLKEDQSLISLATNPENHDNFVTLQTRMKASPIDLKTRYNTNPNSFLQAVFSNPNYLVLKQIYAKLIQSLQHGIIQELHELEEEMRRYGAAILREEKKASVPPETLNLWKRNRSAVEMKLYNIISHEVPKLLATDLLAMIGSKKIETETLSTLSGSKSLDFMTYANLHPIYEKECEDLFHKNENCYLTNKEDREKIIENLFADERPFAEANFHTNSKDAADKLLHFLMNLPTYSECQNVPLTGLHTENSFATRDWLEIPPQHLVSLDFEDKKKCYDILSLARYLLSQLLHTNDYAFHSSSPLWNSSYSEIIAQAKKAYDDYLLPLSKLEKQAQDDKKKYTDYEGNLKLIKTYFPKASPEERKNLEVRIQHVKENENKAKEVWDASKQKIAKYKHDISETKIPLLYDEEKLLVSPTEADRLIQQIKNPRLNQNQLDALVKLLRLHTEQIGFAQLLDTKDLKNDAYTGLNLTDLTRLFNEYNKLQPKWVAEANAGRFDLGLSLGDRANPFFSAYENLILPETAGQIGHIGPVLNVASPTVPQFLAAPPPPPYPLEGNPPEGKQRERKEPPGYQRTGSIGSIGRGGRGTGSTGRGGQGVVNAGRGRGAGSTGRGGQGIGNAGRVGRGGQGIGNIGRGGRGGRGTGSIHPGGQGVGVGNPGRVGQGRGSNGRGRGRGGRGRGTSAPRRGGARPISPDSSPLPPPLDSPPPSP